MHVDWGAVYPRFLAALKERGLQTRFFLQSSELMRV
jgi:hypothetical protein